MPWCGSARVTKSRKVEKWLTSEKSLLPFTTFKRYEETIFFPDGKKQGAKLQIEQQFQEIGRR